MLNEAIPLIFLLYLVAKLCFHATMPDGRFIINCQAAISPGPVPPVKWPLGIRSVYGGSGDVVETGRCVVALRDGNRERPPLYIEP